ncbi:hypothetical protein MIN45_P0538 [Methylomarinovum tepidoasis]|uniref:Cyclic diguanosine monophosphate-binding protein n=1 Tax=Methylomarinovum tepidoasis TaxID=2840183 RepID=A0AAU9C6Z7_9GAMM|nr:PilZ domain-containing protein [Methylomarinovum sp. IN45]BCX88170.1 hypothetical protein MIN45_P0538 [Methylomarinovum sp. IN45]
MSSEDKRRYHRILFQAPARFHDEGRDFPCTIVDLSLQGCLLQADAALPQRGRLEIQLAPGHRITLHLRRVHHQGGRTGFACDHISLEDLSALRRLVELNLGDSALLERDFKALCPAPG